MLEVGLEVFDVLAVDVHADQFVWDVFLVWMDAVVFYCCLDVVEVGGVLDDFDRCAGLVDGWCVGELEVHDCFEFWIAHLLYCWVGVEPCR